MSKTITAREAAAILGVSAATLYSYVSRGLLASSGEPGARSKRYARDDVLRLAARRGDGKRAGHAVSSAMSWGVPVLETRIAHIDGGRLYYRGVDVCALARQATLEQAAALLWQGNVGVAAPPATPGVAPRAQALPDGDAPAPAQQTQRTTLLAATSGLPPLPRAMALLPVLADDAISQDPMALLRLAGGLLLGHDTARAAAGSGAGSAGDVQPLHEQAAAAWRAGDRAAEVLRTALVLLADHELNNSTFTVRCAASSGAAMPLVLCAGLAALSGAEHGGHYTVAKALLQREAAAPGTVIPAPMTPGFGHPLYPQGDIRAACLMAHLHDHDAARCAPYAALAQRANGMPDAQPNSDFALAAMELILDLPDGAALALLAMARTAGWIAHALEQRADRRMGMIRPRARYVGDFNPGS